MSEPISGSHTETLAIPEGVTLEQRHLVESIFAAIGELKDPFLERLAERDGQILDLRITVEGMTVKVEYDLSATES